MACMLALFLMVASPILSFLAHGGSNLLKTVTVIHRFFPAHTGSFSSASYQQGAHPIDILVRLGMERELIEGEVHQHAFVHIRMHAE